MAGFNHNPSKSGSSNSGFKSNKPAGGYNRQGSSSQGEKKEFAPTTHYMVTAAGKGEKRDFPAGVYITEVNDGLRVYIKEDVKAGTYFINKKKDKAEDAPKF